MPEQKKTSEPIKKMPEQKKTSEPIKKTPKLIKKTPELIRINLKHMTIAQLRVANSVYLDNFFTYRYITKATADQVRQKLKKTKPNIYY
jgi:hypothetical protein